MGPIDFLAIEFPGAHITAPGFEQLLSLADQGVIGILDLEFIIVAGIRRDGRPHLSPNWFYRDGQRFYVSTTRDRVK